MKIVRRRLADGTIKTYRYERRKQKLLIGSMGLLIQEYRQSPGYQRLSGSTQRNYDRALGEISALRNVAVTDIRRRHVILLRDKRKDKPAWANKLIAVMSVLMEYAIEMEYRETNPAARVPTLPMGERRRWSDEDIAIAMERFPEPLRRALVLALYTGQRQGDVLAMHWSDYDGEGINVTQQKTGMKLWIPCPAALRDELETWKQGRTSVTIIANTLGKPYTGYSFATLFSREIMKHPELSGLVFHGLRKTAAAKLAEAGCSTHEIAAITGHKTLAMLQLYTLEAEQKQRARAAVVKLENVRKTGKIRDASC